MVTRTWTSLAALTALLPPTTAAAWGDEALEVDGSVRTITAAARNLWDVRYADVVPAPYRDQLDRELAADGTAQALLRLVGAGRVGERLGWEIHGVQALTVQTSPLGAGGMVGVAATGTRYRAADARWRFADEGDVTAELLLDRANVRVSLDALDLVVGRQPLTFGKAHFWNPLDLFFAFDPFQFDRDYKPGVDALRAEIPLGDFSGLTFAAVLGRVTDDPAAVDVWDRSGLLARVWGNAFEWDLAMQVGHVHGGWHVGAGLAGEVEPVEVRAETAYFRPQVHGDLVGDYPEALSAVLGVGRRFESSLFLSAEVLYNGAAGAVGRDRAWALLAEGQVLHASSGIAGLVATYELHPLLQGSLACMTSLSDGSVLVQPGLVYSAADEVEILAGALVTAGDRAALDVGLTPELEPDVRPSYGDEFGSYPPMVYLESKAYF